MNKKDTGWFTKTRNTVAQIVINEFFGEYGSEYMKLEATRKRRLSWYYRDVNIKFAPVMTYVFLVNQYILPLCSRNMSVRFLIPLKRRRTL
jgi:hypothetical protein